MKSRLAGTMSAKDHAGREQAKAHHREEKQDIAGIENAFLNAFEMRHHAKGGDGINEP